ncbi:hypothetical protein ACN27F_17535 [Solwaraspora sp. WMMB335]|uniref:hypothetical protein n=1 Tax=Solwaraspora sp. WMMB335 TaxID=3404118 RepID=UPI003B9467AB
MGERGERGSLTRLGLYGVALVVVFAGSLGFGRLVGDPADPQAAGVSADGDAGSGHDSGHGSDSAPAGLLVSDRGYRLVPQTRALAVGTPTEFRFTIVGPDGEPVTRYTPTHERELHLMVVRRDLSGFQHLHPALGADGTWVQRLTVTRAGQYRVFADFRPAALDTALTLGVDVPAAGDYQPVPLPAPTPAADVGRYRVDLVGDLVAGTASRLSLWITRDGVPVTDLQPYLGAFGHLVALRDGDLAYLHVHPDTAATGDRVVAGPELTFHAEVPAAGIYRLYLDFKHSGVVHTAEFTAAAAAGPAGGEHTGQPDGHQHEHD